MGSEEVGDPAGTLQVCTCLNTLVCSAALFKAITCSTLHACFAADTLIIAWSSAGIDLNPGCAYCLGKVAQKAQAGEHSCIEQQGVRSQAQQEQRAGPL